MLAAAVEVDDAKVLRDTGDQLRDKLGSGVVVLAGTGGAEVKLVAMVTKDLVGQACQPASCSARSRRCSAGAPAAATTWRRAAARTPRRCPQALAAARKWVEDTPEPATV